MRVSAMESSISDELYVLAPELFSEFLAVVQVETTKYQNDGRQQRSVLTLQELGLT